MGAVGESPVRVPVRLAYVSVPGDASEEIQRRAQDVLKALIPEGSHVSLVYEGSELKRDDGGRVVAVLVQDLGSTKSIRRCIQVELVRAGVLDYWTGGGGPEPALHELMEDAVKSRKQ